MRSRPPPSSFHNGRPSALPLMSHSATSIADIAIVRMPAGPAEPAASRNLRGDRLDAQRVLADDERAELVDRMAQGAGQRAAEIGDAEPLDPVIGAQAQPDDRVFRVRVLREAGERLVVRQQDDAGFERGDFHRATFA